MLFSVISISRHYLDKKGNFKIKKNTVAVIFGHSHPECAFNDSLINNFANYAQSGESYFYTYFKVKKILDQNHNLKTIFLEFSNDQLDYERDSTIWADKYISNRVPIYFPFMKFNDFKFLFSHNPSGFLNSVSLYIKDNFKRIGGKNLNYTNHIGGYKYLERDKTDSLLNTTSTLPNEKNNKVSKYSIPYLDRVLQLCKSHNIKVYLVRSPMHPASPELKNEKLYLQILQTHFSEIEFLDFKNFPLLASEFGDLEHLNYRGAKRFSYWFNNLLRQGLLEKAGKQQFIDLEMKEEAYVDKKRFE